MNEEEKVLYLYPQNLKERPKLFFWYLKELFFIAVLFLIGFFALVNAGFYPIIVVAIVMGILTIHVEDNSILDYIIYLFNYFMIQQQVFEWGREPTPFNTIKEEGKESEIK